MSLEIASYQPASHTYRFDVETSQDGNSWMLVWSGNSSQSATPQYQPIDIPNMAARFVRIVGQGGTTVALNDSRPGRVRRKTVR